MRWKRRGMVCMKINFKKYLRYYINSNKRYIILICLILFLAMPFLMLNSILGFYSSPLQAYETGVISVSTVSVVAGCILSFIIPIFNFRYLYKKSSNELYFSLPIKREKLFNYTYLSGLILLLLPLLVYYFICYGYCAIIFPGVRLLFKFLPLVFILLLSILLVAQYTIFTFLSVKCNNILDSILINGSYVVMPLIVFVTAQVFFEKQISQILGNIGGSVSEFLPVDMLTSIASLPSVIYVVIENLNIALLGYYIEKSCFMETIPYVIYWVIIGIICFWFGRKAFIVRKPEEAQERTTTIFGYPVIITVVTFSLLLYIINWSTDLIISSVMIAMLYFCMIFFSNRKIKVKGIHVLIFAVLYVGTFGFGQIYTKTSGFGLVKEFVDASTVEQVEVFGNITVYTDTSYYKNYNLTLNNNQNIMDYTAHTKKEKEISSLMDIQKEVSNRNTDEYGDASYSISFAITTKDGKERYRNYQLELTKDNEEFLKNILEKVRKYSDFRYSVYDEYNDEYIEYN